MTCPIASCQVPCGGPLRICKVHYRLVPRPQQDALNHYARHHKGGPAHHAAFERAVESVETLLAKRRTEPVTSTRPITTPYRDD